MNGVVWVLMYAIVLAMTLAGCAAPPAAQLDAPAPVYQRKPYNLNPGNWT